MKIVPDFQIIIVLLNDHCYLIFKAQGAALRGWDVPDVHKAAHCDADGECGNRGRTAHREVVSVLSYVVVWWTIGREGHKRIQ